MNPFDDGNPQRFYSLSAQIQRERQAYYDMLEQTQKGRLDVTAWLLWFLAALQRAVDQALITLDAVVVKARSWQRWTALPLNEQQIKLLNRQLVVSTASSPAVNGRRIPNARPIRRCTKSTTC